MDWSNERYIRLFTRDTGDWLMWPWQTRALFCFILRKVDRAGILSLGKGRMKALALAVDMPEADVVSALGPLLGDGCVQLNEAGDLIVANFIEAQETISTTASRQRDSRERRRDMVRRGLRPEQRECVLYFIQSEHGGPIKIGRADDVAKRLVQMQTSRPDTLVILATAPGAYEDERRLHDAFATNREKGEWFSPSPGLLALIRDVGTTGHVSRDLSRFVTGHSVPSVPIRTVPSLAERESAPARGSVTRLKSNPPPPSDETPEQFIRDEPNQPAGESGYDLARRVFGELWQAKYRRPYPFDEFDAGPKSEKRVLQQFGSDCFGRAGENSGKAEELARHLVKAYLRDHGDRNWLDENSHPLRTLRRDLVKYGEPPTGKHRVAPKQPAEPVAPAITLDKQASLAALAAGIGKIGMGGLR